MNIKKISREIHEVALEKGFWKDGIDIPKKLLLIITEVSEACEADRKNKWADLAEFKSQYNISQKLNKRNFTVQQLMDNANTRAFIKCFENDIKDSIEDEMADTAIRLFDLCEMLNIDLETHIRLKLDYNKARPKMHGKKY